MSIRFTIEDLQRFEVLSRRQSDLYDYARACAEVPIGEFFDFSMAANFLRENWHSYGHEFDDGDPACFEWVVDTWHRWLALQKAQQALRDGRIGVSTLRKAKERFITALNEVFW